jgi:hypothetical protein
MSVFWSCCIFTLLVSCGALQKLDNASVHMYLGNGCFFARQHLFVHDFEQKSLGRKSEQVSAIAGYAGSTRLGPKGTACYHNPQNFSDYGSLGHAEVVELVVPLSSLDEVFATYFDSFIEVDEGVWARPDVYDQGPEYRSLIGVPGGYGNSQILAAIHRANLHNMTVQPGRGSDPDNFARNSIFLMDSTQFPFVQAELCLQFHDDTEVKYPDSYHRLVGDLENNGRLVSTSCPPNFLCNSTSGLTSAGNSILV